MLRTLEASSSLYLSMAHRIAPTAELVPSITRSLVLGDMATRQLRELWAQLLVAQVPVSSGLEAVLRAGVFEEALQGLARLERSAPAQALADSLDEPQNDFAGGVVGTVRAAVLAEGEPHQDGAAMPVLIRHPAPHPLC